MPLGIWNLQWLNHNSQRAYPLVDWATKTDTTDTITLPDSFIVGLRFPVHAGLDVEPDRFFIKQLVINSTGYNIAIGYDNGADNPIVATAGITRAIHTENRSYGLVGEGDYEDSDGRITIGNLDLIDQLPPGEYSFELADTALEVDAIRPMLRGLQSITLVTASGERSIPHGGHIEIIADKNMRIVANVVDGQPTQIVFSAIRGEGLNEECVCEEGDSEGPCIRFINGIPPLPDGNYRLIGDDCLEFQPILNGLQLFDNCSKPCCGCDELTAVTDQAHRLSDGVATFRQFVNALRSEVTQMSNVVLGSRLADSGCIECE